jgi:hypothetical protein
MLSETEIVQNCLKNFILSKFSSISEFSKNSNIDENLLDKALNSKFLNKNLKFKILNALKISSNALHESVLKHKSDIVEKPVKKIPRTSKINLDKIEYKTIVVEKEKIVNRIIEKEVIVNKAVLDEDIKEFIKLFHEGYSKLDTMGKYFMREAMNKTFELKQRGYSKD